VNTDLAKLALALAALAAGVAAIIVVALLLQGTAGPQ
jgi:hypothetical protein